MVTRTNSGEDLIGTLARNLVATTPILLAGPFAGKSDKAAERAVSRHMAAGEVESHQFKGPMRYYMLTADMEKRLGIDSGHDAFRRALGLQSLRSNYAMAGSSMLFERRKERLTRDEFVAKFPMICSKVEQLKHYRTRYFVDDSEKESQHIVRIGMFVVDHGRQAMGRFARKIRREIERRRENTFAPFIKQRLLCPCILTAFPARAKEIQAALANETFPVRVEIVPGFADLY